MIRRRGILEEPHVGPLGELSYFMTTLREYGDPFSRGPAWLPADWESDDGVPMPSRTTGSDLHASIGMPQRLAEQLNGCRRPTGPGQSSTYLRRDDTLILWPTPRQWVAWRLRGQHFDKPTVSRMFADYGRQIEAQS